MSSTLPNRSRPVWRRAALAAAALAALAPAACRRAPAMPIPEPGTRPVTSADPASPVVPIVGEDRPAAADTARRAHTAADVRFLQHMIPHHAQALVMTALVPSRTETPGVRLVAERIAASQRSEIATMQQWLRAHGETVPEAMTAPAGDSAAGGHAGHAMPASGGDAHAGMPGMLSAAELQRLAGARGAEFDRLFLDFMIRHHEGALQMVAELLATPGAAQSAEVFQIASEVDADQRAEIARMRALQRR